MTRPEQSEDEERYLRWFLERCEPARGSRFERLPPPDPDYCIWMDSTCIGIELTEFVGSKRERRLEGAQDAVVERAKELYIAAGGPPVMVHLNWTPGFLPSTRGDSAAADIARLVREHLPSVGGSTSFEASGLPGAPFAQQAFESVWITRIPDDPEYGWVSNRSWWGSRAEPSVIQAELDRKSGKPAKYLRRFAERWLVLLHRGSQPSSGFNVPPEAREHRYTSAFERVFVFSMTPPDVWELLVAKS